MYTTSLEDLRAPRQVFPPTSCETHYPGHTLLGQLEAQLNQSNTAPTPRENCIGLVRDYSDRSTLGHVIANAAINATSQRDVA
uniref:(California timema) hypothetical protein n=1 Tax=Timema californicum TaxID=61474 RepID=A0A7R9JGP2_TIMCA|nr:unnamed protein product [Timema californicum]